MSQYTTYNAPQYSYGYVTIRNEKTNEKIILNNNDYVKNLFDDSYFINMYNRYNMDNDINTNIFKDSYKEFIENMQNFQEIDISEENEFDNNNEQIEVDMESDNEDMYTDYTSDSSFDDEDGWVST